MPALDELFQRLSQQHAKAGAEVVVQRAIVESRRSDGAILAEISPTRAPAASRRRRVTGAVAIAGIGALVVGAVVVNAPTDRKAQHEQPEPIVTGPSYPAPKPATARQLAAMQWTPTARAPIPLLESTDQLTAWAGDELVVFGADQQHDDPHGVGASYSPGTDSWRRLPRAPLTSSFGIPMTWAWTGRELIVFSHAWPDTRGPVAQAFNPRTRQWRVLPPAPLCTVSEPGAVWTGRLLVVAGGLNVAGSQCSNVRDAATATYDPSTNRWAQGPTLPVAESETLVSTTLTWVANRVVAVVATRHQYQSSVGTAPDQGATTTMVASITDGPARLLVYAWSIGASAWTRIHDLHIDSSNQLPNSLWWRPFVTATALVVPPWPRDCRADLVVQCSQQTGGVALDVGDPRRQVPLDSAQMPTDIRAVVFAGRALIEWATTFDREAPACRRVACPQSIGGAWDPATGRFERLAPIAAVVSTVQWTGDELLAVVDDSNGGAKTIMRLGVAYRSRPDQATTYRWHSVSAAGALGEVVTIDGVADTRHDRFAWHLLSSVGVVGGADFVLANGVSYLGKQSHGWCAPAYSGPAAVEVDDDVRHSNFDPVYWRSTLRDGATSKAITIDRFLGLGPMRQVTVTRTGDTIVVRAADQAASASAAPLVTLSAFGSAAAVVVPTPASKCQGTTTPTD